MNSTEGLSGQRRLASKAAQKLRGRLQFAERLGGGSVLSDFAGRKEV